MYLYEVYNNLYIFWTILWCVEIETIYAYYLARNSGKSRKLSEARNSMFEELYMSWAKH